MAREKRIEILLITFCAFVSSFILYGIAGTLNPAFENKIYGFLLVGLMAGYAISSIVFSIVLAARFFAKRSMTLKVVAALLWFIPLFGTIIVGMIIHIPYQIYNIVEIFTDK